MTVVIFSHCHIDHFGGHELRNGPVGTPTVTAAPDIMGALTELAGYLDAPDPDFAIVTP